MRIKLKVDFDEGKAGEICEVDDKRGCLLQGMGAADILERDEPGKGMIMIETAQSKALNAKLEKKKNESAG